MKAFFSEEPFAISTKAMELVSGGDLLSSLTGEPQVYEDRCCGQNGKSWPLVLTSEDVDQDVWLEMTFFRDTSTNAGGSNKINVTF